MVEIILNFHFYVPILGVIVETIAEVSEITVMKMNVMPLPAGVGITGTIGTQGIISLPEAKKKKLSFPQMKTAQSSKVCVGV